MILFYCTIEVQYQGKEFKFTIGTNYSTTASSSELHSKLTKAFEENFSEELAEGTYTMKAQVSGAKEDDKPAFKFLKGYEHLLLKSKCSIYRAIHGGLNTAWRQIKRGAAQRRTSSGSAVPPSRRGSRATSNAPRSANTANIPQSEPVDVGPTPQHTVPTETEKSPFEFQDILISIKLKDVGVTLDQAKLLAISGLYMQEKGFECPPLQCLEDLKRIYHDLKAFMEANQIS